jgi:hypothetical protein
MEISKKIKFQDIVEDSSILKVEELSVLEGGIGVIGGVVQNVLHNEWECEDGCATQICKNNRQFGSDHFCEGSATCSSGIDVCIETT